VEQSLTSGNEDKRLLSMQNISLLFKDSDAAVLGASALGWEVKDLK
jgi:hypothetical protein